MPWRFGERGIDFGAGFRGVQVIWAGGRQAMGAVTLQECLIAEAERCTFHPAFLDACLQPLAAVWPVSGTRPGLTCRWVSRASACMADLPAR